MIVPNSTNFDKYLGFFGRHFDLDARLPKIVFRKKTGTKFLIRQSGELHRAKIFSRLGEEYDDNYLSCLVIEPKAANIFRTQNDLLAYSLSAEPKFLDEWHQDTSNLVQQPNSEHKLSPWMLASLQFYVGSSEAWSSCHDNRQFELDIFCVPIDCDTNSIFGQSSWTFEDFLEFSSANNLNYPEHELQELRENYFDLC